MVRRDKISGFFLLYVQFAIRMGIALDCAEGSGISSASEIGHWIHLHLQKSQMGWRGDLCLLDLVRLHRWKWFETTTVME